VRYLSLFSGIEAATAAWHTLGWECVGVSEIEPFPCGLLAEKYPHVPNLGDVTAIDETAIALLGPIDLIVFGSPCQDLSVAGKRKGLAGERSGLFHTAIRIIQWAREHCGLRWALWENVPGAFSSNQGRDFAVVVGELAGLEHVDVPRHGWGNEGCAVGEHGMVEWSTLDAQWFGVAQRRRRVFAVADFGDWFGRQPILLEPYRLRGDSAPRREAGQEVAGCLSARTQGGGLGTDFDIAGGLQPVHGLGVVSTLDASYARLQGCSGQDANHGHSHLVVMSFDTTQVTSSTNRSAPAYGDPCHPLAAGAHVPAIAFNWANGGGYGNAHDGLGVSIEHTPPHGRSQVAAVCVTGHVTHTLKADGFDASEDGTGRGQHIVAFAIGSHAGCADGDQTNRSHEGGGPVGGNISEELAYSLRGGRTQSVSAGMQVRRLTPMECERLQGFGDNYTNVTYRGKPAADGPRYKALGNSMAVPVMRWIGRQLEMVGLFQ
jgi:DNA (cytosine-5)-methyltransferase 1